VYTGSGLGQMRGIIPRAMEQVGRYKAVLEGQGWQYSMQVSFLEIYNEQIRDLLRDRPSSSSSSNSNNDYDGKHEIKRDIRGVTTVTDLSLLPVDPNDSAEVERILELAASHRSVGSTAMNSRSSRSHSVFTLHLTGTNASAGSALKGALHLVDLAGSERVGRSGVTGDQLKETVSINKSLSSLVDVFTALANKNAHVPFRNSKLTYLLQPALSGEGKTGMIVNVSPTEQSYGESLCSLRFAAQVNQCELGKAKRSIKSISNSSSDDSSSTSSSSSVTASTASSSSGSRPPTSRKASGASR
jgi:kinesin family member C1